MIYTCENLDPIRLAESIKMDHQAWKENLLESVAQLGEEGRRAVGFLRARGTRIGLKRARPNVGAFWTLWGTIHLNSRYYTYETPLDNLRIKTLIIHEARHLQQGLITALSVYGELDAWQLEFGVYYRITGRYPHPAIRDLMALPLALDRKVLKEAACLMQAYAGKGYRIDLLPLFPLPLEIKYWLTRR